jgi:hypothetical protein
MAAKDMHTRFSIAARITSESPVDFGDSALLSSVLSFADKNTGRVTKEVYGEHDASASSRDTQPNTLAVYFESGSTEEDAFTAEQVKDENWTIDDFIERGANLAKIVAMVKNCSFAFLVSIGLSETHLKNKEFREPLECLQKKRVRFNWRRDFAEIATEGVDAEYLIAVLGLDTDDLCALKISIPDLLSIGLNARLFEMALPENIVKKTYARIVNNGMTYEIASNVLALSRRNELFVPLFEALNTRNSNAN